jgi:non-ribosomal peptide synthetase component E (peptide arylation enzyme)
MNDGHRFSEQTTRAFVSQGFWVPEHDYLREHRVSFAKRVAIIDGDQVLAYSEYDRLVGNLAKGFITSGIEKGAVVAFQVPNVVEHFLLLQGLRRAGFKFLALDMTLRAAELGACLNLSEAQTLVSYHGFGSFDYLTMHRQLVQVLPALRSLVIAGNKVALNEGEMEFAELLGLGERSAISESEIEKRWLPPSQVVGLKLTSGSASSPKIAKILGYVPVKRIEALISRFQLTPDDVLLAMAPLTGGAGRVLPIWCAHPVGASVVLMRRFSAEEALSLIEKHRITIACGVPTQLIKLLELKSSAAKRAHYLKAIFYTGARLAPDAARELMDRFDCPVVGLYGSQDGGIYACGDIRDEPSVLATTSGKLFPDIEARVVDDNGLEVPRGAEGELLFRGAGVNMGGYLGDPDGTLSTFDSSGWYYTGDLGYFDAQANLVVSGRKKEIINRGGWKITPREIEDSLLTHPKITNVAVVRMPDPVLGEKACAYVSLLDGETLTFEEMTKYLMAQGLAIYKLPERLEVVREFPLVAGQKISKRDLEDDIKRKLFFERSTQ